MLLPTRSIWWITAAAVLFVMNACGGGGEGQSGGGTGPLVLNFGAPDIYNAGQIQAVAQSVVVGDFDDDGASDIAVANEGDNNAGVFLNNGDGTFQPQVEYTTQTNPQVIATGDFNGDDLLDLLAGTSSDFASVLPNTGTGGEFDTSTDVDFGAPLVGIGVADFDNDGDLDGVFSAGTDLKFLDNDGAANFAAVTSRPVEMSHPPVAQR